ncbi:ArsR/SmtB family transcription factor [Clostridium perfringens]|uniref:Metalloregulator ArsR/SmtB family transcription factor n=1 Tax=Clostridium perfringens TaxID=1502 RepID=A0AAW9ISM7_CLOPF|nr:metalloregulator ArsR/SmtB family transcription factor [Clostridium perfringens]EHK2363358.1 winged helix-turn-helix transcriptional regulator [Clostridium perfringens]EHK2401528.1 winged helix-turn-helix transcriptional regulator [Clostridium perfringens]EJT5927353.1 winged helix-turn-helix transcriptional regulator [Clostridium perfringens]EJT6482050.1 winged helix-turn-helix transcriptional regulator [Clostridium perfringens]MBI5982858.1 winged helix-turn-helix transcriptional regulator 
MENNYMELEKQAEFLKVLAHPVRLCIIKGLMKKNSCNVSFMQECLDMPQSTISQHLQKLRSVGIIEGERNGLEVNYKIKDKKVEEIIKILLDMNS